MKTGFAILILAVLMVGCGKPAGGKTEQAAASPAPNTASSSASNPTTDPCEPHCAGNTLWVDLGPRTNAIDGTKKEFLSLKSTDTVLTSIGELRHAEMNLCFENGWLCGKDSVGVGVNVHGMVEPKSYESQYSTTVRIRFDDDKPSRQTWGIADSHDALYPSGREEQFLLQLIRHKKLILEFSYYEKVPQTLTFEISGLDDKLKSISIDVKAQAAARESSARARSSLEQEQKNAGIEAFMGAHTEIGKNIAAQIGLCKNKNFPDEYCWEPADGSGPWGPFSTVKVATKYAIEHYKDHAKAP